MTPRTLKRTIVICATGALLLTPLMGQGRGGTTTGSTGNTGGTGSTGATGTTGGTIGTGSIGTPTTGRTNTNTNNTNTNTTSTTPAYQQPLFVSGRVVLEDGTPPSQPAVIERICLGNPHAEGYTDTHGYFMIQLGNEAGVFQDASESFGSSPMGMPGMGGQSSAGVPSTNTSTRGLNSDNPYMNCDLRAKLPGYRSQSVSLANRRPMDDPNIGNILLHREGADEGTTVSASSLAAPKDARKAFTKAQELRKKHKIDDAADELAKATQIYPAYAEAWFELGLIQASRGQTADARQSFEQAIKGDPKFVNPYVEMSVMEMRAKRWPELAALTAKAIKLDSFDYPQLYLFNGVANYNEKDFDSAEKSVREALRLDTRHVFPDSERLMGLVLIQKQNYTDAAEHLRAYLRVAPESDESAAVRKQVTLLEGAIAANKH